jgi:hypothetical protein
MLEHPPLIEANPGDPITSEAWNNLIESVKALYDALNKPQGTLVVKLVDKSNSEAVRDAVVSLVSEDGPPRAAQYVGASIQAYVAAGVPPGKYSLFAEAEDYAVEKREVTVGEETDVQTVSVEMTLSVEEVVMPNLFGFTVTEALKALSNRTLVLGRLIDSHGTDVPPAAVPAELLGARVLNQVPEAGLPVELKQPVQLHISAKTEAKPSVKVPNLSGMTYAQATAALESAGLKIAAPVTSKG